MNALCTQSGVDLHRLRWHFGMASAQWSLEDSRKWHLDQFEEFYGSEESADDESRLIGP